MLVATPILGGALLFFTQLPGGFLDAVQGGTQESALYAALFHILYLAGLGAFLYGMASDLPPRILLGIHVLGAILTFPFGVVLARDAWRVTQEDGWDEGYNEASRVGRAHAFRLGGVWGLTQVVAGVATLIAYVAILSGTLLIGLAAIASNLVIQAGGLMAIRAWQAKTKLQTYGSPLPELPS